MLLTVACCCCAASPLLGVSHDSELESARRNSLGRTRSHPLPPVVSPRPSDSEPTPSSSTTTTGTDGQSSCVCLWICGYNWTCQVHENTRGLNYHDIVCCCWWEKLHSVLWTAVVCTGWLTRQPGREMLKCGILEWNVLDSTECIHCATLLIGHVTGRQAVKVPSPAGLPCGAWRIVTLSNCWWNVIDIRHGLMCLPHMLLIWPSMWLWC